MSQRQPYTYQFASSSSHGILIDPPNKPITSSEAPDNNSRVAPSERTPLIQGGSIDVSPERGRKRRASTGKLRQEYHEQQTTGPSPPPEAESSRTALEREAQRKHDVSHAPEANGFHYSSRKGITNNIALTLQNTGSVARDHLASERTFLAYVRTSLAIASAGVALAQILSITEFSSEDTRGKKKVEAYARPLGASAVLLALLVLGVGVTRYFQIQQALVKGRFPAARMALVLLAAMLGALVAATFGLLMHARLKHPS
ncbi:hypothetical protein DXG03_003688 [Asterophora parasitica]|uniref:DUF202 domain-containing protein n=1 Tax=Asterophora parasitica TaxID=117018 RepID=A0A9P7KF07_9AGAR|nr:hypothetical protein DXG03_003688 [Asterophora parasitica]